MGADGVGCDGGCDRYQNGPARRRQHAVRGGSWHATATSWRSAFRKGYEPDYRGISIGFRVVMTE